MVTVHREVEKKYTAVDGVELPPLIELAAGAGGGGAGARDAVGTLAEGEAATQRLVATYFDTTDLRLAGAGLTLRRRTGGDDAGWHLKVPAGKDARSEVRLPLGRSATTVPAKLRSLVWATTSGAALQPVAEVVTERTVRRLVDATGLVVAELADDRVLGRRLLPLAGSSAGMVTSWREIEVEVDEGAVELLAVVDARLRERGLQESASSSKLARVLGVEGRRGRGTGKPAELTAKTAGGKVILAHLRDQVDQVRTQDLPVRLDAPDSVHKMRVATRRLRSALKTFKPLFAADVARPLRGELKWLAGELGAARDAEVMRDRLAAAVAGQDDGEDLAPAARTAIAELEQIYRTAHDRVLSELDGDRYCRLLTALEELVTSPPLTEHAATPAGKGLPRLVARSYAEVRRLVEEDTLPAGAEREELLHDARKAAKRARYAAESVSSVFGPDAVAFAEAMEAVQEALGEHQDSVFTRERLRELARQTDSSDVAFLYGRLYALEEVREQQRSQHVDAAWKAARSKSLHRWLR